jgi:hypothetical protein
LAGGGKRKKSKDPRPQGDGGGDDDGCDILIDLDLQGVRAEGLIGLGEGEELALRLESINGYEAIICVRADGVTVGAIANFTQHAALLRCLRRSVPYRVRVSEVRSGGCHVIGGRVDR